MRPPACAAAWSRPLATSSRPGSRIPADAEPPANGSPRFRAIVRRQVESLDWLRVPLRFYDLQAVRPDPPTGWSVALRRPPPRVVAVRDEWPRIRADIEAGRAPIVGLVRVAGWSPRLLTANHQVLAYAYDEDAAGFRIRVYDPNHPGRDDVELVARLDAERRPAPGASVSGWPSRRASRCSASSASATRALARWPPGGDRAQPVEFRP